MTVMLQAGSFADARLLCHAKERRCHASRVRLVLRVALQQSRRAAHAAEPRHGPRQALQAMRRCFVGGGEVNPPCPPVGVAQLLEPRRGGRPRCEQCIDTGVQLRDAGAQLGPQRLARLLAPLLTPQRPCPPGRGRSPSVGTRGGVGGMCSVNASLWVMTYRQGASSSASCSMAHHPDASVA